MLDDDEMLTHLAVVTIGDLACSIIPGWLIFCQSINCSIARGQASLFESKTVNHHLQTGSFTSADAGRLGESALGWT